MSAPPVLTELKLSAEMKDAINKAFEVQKPIVVAYVDDDWVPRFLLACRASQQASELQRRQTLGAPDCLAAPALPASPKCVVAPPCPPA